MLKFKVLISLAVVIALIFFFWSILPQRWHNSESNENERNEIEGEIKDRLFTSSDVDLGIIPYHKLFKAIDEGQKRLDQSSHQRSVPGTITNSIWRQRGPNNRGGRTRAIMIDESDPNRNRIWIGCVTGGIWRTEDITLENPDWISLGKYFESLSISGIAQDPNNHNNIYVSTGESYTGDAQSAGIFKSTDDGASWTQLPSTAHDELGTINEIYVHTNGDIYASTAGAGLMRSHDGNSWEKVLGSGVSGANNNNFHDFLFNKVNQTFYTSNDFTIYKSTTGNQDDWTNIGTSKPGFLSNVNRVEFTICPSDPNILYAIGAVGSYSSKTAFTNDGGENWSTGIEPAIFATYGQAWYDLDLAADPSNCVRILSGGVQMAESISQGMSWKVIGRDMHVDHHNITFDPERPGRIFFGNDGGIWMSEDGGATIVDKSIGYVTTQFYAGAIHPDSGSPYIMGGTQDNNSLIIEEAGLSPSRVAWQGDGIFCFIDQNEPNIQIVSSQGGNYGLSLNGGIDFFSGAAVDGQFVNRSGYDDNANILYGQVNQSGVNDIDFFRWNINTFQVENVDIKDLNVVVSAVKADPNVPNRVYFGGQSGIVVMTDNTNTGNPVHGTVFADLPGNATVSCIYMDKLTSDHVLISLFNYGDTLQNLWVTYNAGADWNSIEGDLPDIPVRWAIFDPADHDRAMIATDAGIWATDDINGEDTHWEPTNPDNGMPFVRVDMLLLRESDKIVLGATYGRGLMTTDIFSTPAVVIKTPSIAYAGQSIVIDGSESVNAQNYEWDLGDNSTNNTSKFNHSYSSGGIYTITLTINGNVIGMKTISILPYLPIPYEHARADYTGDFETHPEHFASNTIQGTGFERGVSAISGKDGTNSGIEAWVLGINDNLYQNNSIAELYTPLFDFSKPQLYELKFWTKYVVQSHNDGFRIEYSTDLGSSWHVLGSNEDPHWYTYKNVDLVSGAFPIGSSYFSNGLPKWTQFAKDVSFLAGNPKVSFKYVFRSNYDGQAPGVSIDDFEVYEYAGDLKTTLTSFNANYTGDQDITVNWSTGIEYQCRKFILERSFTGLGFTEVSNTSAAGVLSIYPHDYSTIDKSLRKVIYYRLKVINDNPDIPYHLEYYSDTIVVRRGVDPDKVQTVLTNPFSDRINISFSSFINQNIIIRLFDTSGRLVKDEEFIPNGVAYSLDNLHLTPGIYILTVQIGDTESTAYKLFTTGN